MLNLFRVLSTHNLKNISILSKCAQLSRFHNIRMKNNTTILSSFFKPIIVQPNSGDLDVGAEIVGKLDKNEVVKALNKFTQKQEIKKLCWENGLDGKICMILVYFLTPLFCSVRPKGIFQHSLGCDRETHQCRYVPHETRM